MTRRCPSWLEWDEAKGWWKPKPDAKRTILYIYKRTIEGIGQQRLTAELQRKFKPFTGEKWYGSMVANLLLSRALLGELVTDGKPAIPDYYPRIVPDSIFYQARAASTSRRNAKGRSGLFVNLLVGLVRFMDGHPGYVQTSSFKDSPKRRFVSRGHRERVDGSCPLSVDYRKVERYIMAILYQLRPADLLDKGKGGKGGDTIKGLERELAGVELRKDELQEALSSSRQSVPELVSAIEGLRSRADKLKGTIENLRQQEATRSTQPLEQAQSILSILEKKPEDERHDLRLKLRGLIADVVERVELSPYRVEGKREVEAVITIRLMGDTEDTIDSRNIVNYCLNPIDTGEITPEQVAEVIHTLATLSPRRQRHK